MESSVWSKIYNLSQEFIEVHVCKSFELLLEYLPYIYMVIGFFLDSEIDKRHHSMTLKELLVVI